jgi:hypothetical protein
MDGGWWKNAGKGVQFLPELARRIRAGQLGIQAAALLRGEFAGLFEKKESVE